MIKKVFKTIVTISLLLLLVSCKTNLTDEKLQELIKTSNIEDLTWDDFDSYHKQVDKTNDKVWVFELDNGSTLFLVGDKESEKPHSISIVEIDGRSTYLKIKSE